MGKRINFDAESFEKNDQRNFDFDPEGVNVNQDFEKHVDTFVEVTREAYGKDCHLHGFKNDIQLSQASACALRAFQDGFYTKKPRSANFANGRWVTVTDRGVDPGDRDIETSTTGARYTPVNDGITAPDKLPERSVTVAEDLRIQSYKPIRDKAFITVQMIAEGQKRGFSKIEQLGTELRNQHEQNLNRLILRGNAGANLMGITNHVDILRRMAAFNWGTASAADIYDDYNAALRQMWNSVDEDGMPPLAILPPVQYHHIKTENFGAGTDTTLKSYIMDNNEGHEISFDFNMRAVDSLGNPGALMMHTDNEVLRVTMPFWMMQHSPFQVDELKTRILIESRFAGVQINDTDKIMLVEGTGASWAAFD